MELIFESSGEEVSPRDESPKHLDMGLIAIQEAIIRRTDLKSFMGIHRSRKKLPTESELFRSQSLGVGVHKRVGVDTNTSCDLCHKARETLRLGDCAQFEPIRKVEERVFDGLGGLQGRQSSGQVVCPREKGADGVVVVFFEVGGCFHRVESSERGQVSVFLLTEPFQAR